MHAADDRRDMVLAMGFEADVAQHHDLVVAAGLLEGALEIFARIVVIAGKPFLVGAHDAPRRGAKPFAAGIVAGPADQRAHGILGLRARRPYRPRRPARLGGFAAPASGIQYLVHPMS